LQSARRPDSLSIWTVARTSGDSRAMALSPPQAPPKRFRRDGPAAGRPTSRYRLANDTGSTGEMVADTYPQMPQKNNPQDIREERRD
jgi:hypothetical protein